MGNQEVIHSIAVNMMTTSIFVYRRFGQENTGFIPAIDVHLGSWITW